MNYLPSEHPLWHRPCQTVEKLNYIILDRAALLAQSAFQGVHCKDKYQQGLTYTVPKTCLTWSTLELLKSDIRNAPNHKFPPTPQDCNPPAAAPGRSDAGVPGLHPSAPQPSPPKLLVRIHRKPFFRKKQVGTHRWRFPFFG